MMCMEMLCDEGVVGYGIKDKGIFILHVQRCV